MNDREFKLVRDAARRESMSVSTFIRRLAVREAEQGEAPASQQRREGGKGSLHVDFTTTQAHEMNPKPEHSPEDSEC